MHKQINISMKVQLFFMLIILLNKNLTVLTRRKLIFVFSFGLTDGDTNVKKKKKKKKDLRYANARDVRAIPLYLDYTVHWYTPVTGLRRGLGSTKCSL